MSNIGFPSASSHHAIDRKLCQQALRSQFEKNSAAFGPVAASVIGIADAATDVISDAASAGGQALSSLGSTAQEGVEAVGDVVDDISQLIQAGARYANQGAQLADDAIDQVGDALSDAADSVRSGLTAGAQTIASLL